MIYLLQGRLKGLSILRERDIFNKRDERRKSERIELHVDLCYQIRGQVTDCSRGVTANVSVGGLAMSVDKFMPALTSLNIEINLLPRVIHSIAKVVWCQPLSHSDKCRVGVEFIEMDSREREFLLEYINMQAGIL